MSDTLIQSHLGENRSFDPPKQFGSAANINADRLQQAHQSADSDSQKYWAEAARDLVWHREWTQTLDWSRKPYAKWFVGGELNATESCLDRHMGTARENKTAILWEGEGGDVREYSYAQLLQEVCQAANALKSQGIAKGDRVAIYMPMVPEIVVAMLACARIGATHSVVFGGFSAESLRDRIQDAGCKMVITADGGYRKGKIVELKKAVDDALADNACPTVTSVLVYQRTAQEIPMVEGRDVWWHDTVPQQEMSCHPEYVDSEHPLFILYTSGTTGKPKGVVHSTGGYMTHALRTCNWVFDLKDEDVYWCTADAGWITGHTYVTYGPLAAGATNFMYEGAPTYPTPDRFWSMIAKHDVSIFYTAPTAIRTFMRLGDQHPQAHDMDSLRLLGTVGEPNNPEARTWYHKVIGGERCPIVDTWWQTETGGIMITPLPGVTATKPGTATRPLPGIAADVVREDGTSCDVDEGGYLVVKEPWPSMIRGVWGDEQRFVDTYWNKFDGNYYFAGDGARKDKDGYFWIMGRVDDVVNVSGHRLGTMEVESALVKHPSIAEAAVVSRPDEITGEAIVAFVTPIQGKEAGEALKNDLMAMVAKEIGAFARPAQIRFANAVPKTRSGKIMRRLLRELASSGTVTGDTTTLEDFSVIANLRDEEE
ncbi:MAG: acetate--CoA ligase [Myxococcales bacterium]|nr:acetate--CoA ligase [Myxococcales bacterium]